MRRTTGPVARLAIALAVVATATASGRGATAGDPSETEPTRTSESTGSTPSSAPTTESGADATRIERIATLLARAQTVELALSPTGGDDQTRVVTSAGEPLTIPVDPRRIVTIEPSLTHAVAALGYGDRIVGTVEDPSTGDFHEHIAEFLGPDVVSIGGESEPNLEQLALTDPDLILTWDWYADQVPALRQIAPTVVVPYEHYDAEVGETLSNEQFVTWLVREVAAVLGADERARR